jgi:uncharacterized membrane protein
LIFFIPGYAGTWALYPQKDDITLIERIALSFILSVATVILCALFLDIVIGVDTTGLNIVITLLFITLFLLVVCMCRILFHRYFQEGVKKIGMIFSLIKQKIQIKARRM